MEIPKVNTYDRGDGIEATAWGTLGLEILDLWVRVVPIKLLEAAVETASTLDVLEEAIELKVCWIWLGST